MIYSPFQQAIFDFIKFDSRNLQCQACAGSGKSFTIKNSVRFTPPGLDIFIGAFNKHIANPLQREIVEYTPPGSKIVVSTLNSFGWGICRENIRDVELDAQKTFNILQTQFDMRDRQDTKKFWRYQGSIRRMVGLFKANIRFETPNIDEVEEIADFVGVELPYKNDSERQDYWGYLSYTFRRGLQVKHLMDFDDQVFMPIYCDMEIQKHSLGYIDELQDLNPIQIELMLRALGRIIGVGDRRQAIYAFRGADVRAMDTFMERTHAECLPLSICYRCPKKVVTLAQQIIGANLIQPADDAPDGIIENVKKEDFRKNAKDNDYVLCRTTEPLVSECLRMIREGRKATVKGRDIGVGLLDLIDKITDRDDNMDARSFFGELNKYHDLNYERLDRANREAEIVVLQDRVETLKVLLEHESDVRGIKKRIDQIFPKPIDGIEPLVGVIFCTVHKAKGLESDRIWILRRDLMPHPKSVDKPHQLEQEKNLEYVAYTRVVYRRNADGIPCSQGELYFVQEPKS